MAEAAAPAEEAPKKRSKLPLILGLVAALLLGGGGFYATFSGLILSSGEAHGAAEGEGEESPLPDIAFVALDPMVVSLGDEGSARYLKFSAQVEVAKTFEVEVTLLKPRLLDVLNEYLRAVEVAEIEDPTALVRLRAQILRRIQVVSGEGRVRDLLITEFVLN